MSTIHQEVVFPAAPLWIYTTLVDPARFGAITRAPARGVAIVGEEFSAFGGFVCGRYLELVPGRLIVQTWREAEWPEGHYSTARFELGSTLTDTTIGGIETIYGEGTRVALDHDGFPPHARDHLERSWQKNYWDRIFGAFC